MKAGTRLEVSSENFTVCAWLFITWTEKNYLPASYSYSPYCMYSKYIPGVYGSCFRCQPGLKAEQRREASSEKACTGSYCQEQDFILMRRLETNMTFQMLSLSILWIWFCFDAKVINNSQNWRGDATWMYEYLTLKTIKSLVKVLTKLCNQK